MARKSNLPPATTKQVRIWAEGKGIDCPAYGKIPNAVREAFTNATGRTIAPSYESIHRSKKNQDSLKGQTFVADSIEHLRAQTDPISELEANDPEDIAGELEPAWISKGRAYAEERARIRMAQIARAYM